MVMAIADGTQLGRYQIRSQLGVGGMGEVYLGHDSQLERTVAIKILPEKFAQDSLSSERLPEREPECSGPASIRLEASNGDAIFATGFGQGTPTATPDVSMIVETYTITAHRPLYRYQRKFYRGARG